MTAQKDNQGPVYAMVFANRLGGPEMYLGPCTANLDETDADLLERIGKTPMAEWFTDLRVVVHNRRST